MKPEASFVRCGGGCSEEDMIGCLGYNKGVLNAWLTRLSVISIVRVGCEVIKVLE